MSSYAPELTRSLLARGIYYVRLEYCGREGRGDFIAIEFARDEGKDSAVNCPEIKATFQPLLMARDPGWARDNGSCGDFRWDLRADSLTHSHYALGNGNERLTYHGI